MRHNKDMMPRRNPVVQEAICFVGFEGTATDSLFTDYHRLVATEYPNLLPVSVPEELASQQFMRFARTGGEVALTLSLNSLTLHVLPPYPGWDQVERRLFFAWETLLQATSLNASTPLMVTYLVVRYINVIPCRSESETLGYWLEANDFLPAALLESDPLTRCQVQRNTNGGADFQRVTVQKSFSGTNTEGVFVWEIERGQAASFLATPQGIVKALSDLHDGVRKTFDSAIGPNLQHLMETEPSL